MQESRLSSPLGIVIVDYKNPKRTIQFIQNELKKITLAYKVVVVCNACSDEDKEAYLDALDINIVGEQTDITKNYFLIPCTDNLGFARANNIGADYLIKNFDCKYLLFSNNDISIYSENCVETLLSILRTNETVGMIGPEVIGLDGKRQSPHPYVPIADGLCKMYLYTPFMTKQKKIKRFQLDYSERASEGFHYRIMGSFFILPVDTYEQMGKMDPNTFLYAEEMIISEKLKRINKKVYFCPRVRVIHEHGVTTGKYLGITRSVLIQGQSEKYYYTQYCGVPRLKANILYFIYYSLIRLKGMLKS